MARMVKVVPASTRPSARTDVIGQTLNNGMNPLKNGLIYIYICNIPIIRKTPHGYTNEILYHARFQNS